MDVCKQHKQTFIGYCYECKKFKCKQCLFQHQLKNHKITKIQPLIQSWQNNLNMYYKQLLQKKKNISLVTNNDLLNLLYEAEQKIDKYKQEIVFGVQEFFKALKKSLKNLLQNSFSERPEFIYQKFINQKIVQVQKWIQNLKKDIFYVKILQQQQIFNKIYKLLDEIEIQEIEINKDVSKDIIFPKLNYNQLSLCKFSDNLSQLIGFTNIQFNQQQNKIMFHKDLYQTIKLRFFQESSNLFFTFIPNQKKIQKYQIKTNFPLRAFQLNSKKYLFIIGGKFKNKPTSQVLYIDQSMTSAQLFLNLNNPRIGHTCIYCNQGSKEIIYIIGGKSSKQNWIKEIEYFDCNNKQIKSYKTVNFTIFGASACKIRKKIYLFGGFNKQYNKSPIIQYNTNNNTFSQIIPNNFELIPLRLNSLLFPIDSNNIIVLGGCRKQKKQFYFSDSSLIYNFKFNIYVLNNNQLQVSLKSESSSCTYCNNKIYSLCSTQYRSNIYGPNMIDIFEYNVQNHGKKLLKIGQL